MCKEKTSNDVLCCPLCGSEEYLLSSSDKMLCAECGSFFEDIKTIVNEQPIPRPISNGQNIGYVPVSLMH